jgi:hypothetical protein
MLPILSLALLGLPALALSSASASASTTAHVYLYPPTPRSAQSQSAGPAVLAQHLGLEAFESLSQKTPHSEVVLGNARPFVGEGGRDVLLVSIDAGHPEGLYPYVLVCKC